MAFDLLTGRIIFIGAGFSAGAGIPLTNTLLQNAASLFQDQTPGLFERVCNYAAQVDVDLQDYPNAEDFARLCTHLEFVELREYAGGERWSNQGSREKLALKFFLSKSIALATPAQDGIPEQYIKFVQSLNPSDIIVSFNWDLLLELAMDKAGKDYSYNYEEGKIQIIKLHGSMNWSDGEPRTLGEGRFELKYQPLGYAEGLMTNEVYSSNLLKNHGIWRQAEPLVDGINPLIVLPGFGKAFDVRILSHLWYRIEFLNIRSGGVSIIGLSVSDDDFIVESLFRYLFRGTFPNERPIHIINPDEKSFDRFQIFGEGNNLLFKNEKFTAETLEFALLK